MIPIDWQLLSNALNYYGSLGYRYVEVPWIVPDQISRMTFDAEGLNCQLGTLIGSAEQGFLAMPEVMDEWLVACSPCFRNEPVIDDLHHHWFMKVELYRSGNHLEEMLQHAFSFFEKRLDCHIITTNEGYDIMVDDIEIGSYGYRTTSARDWTYGTGLALPRFSIAKDRSEQ